MKCQFCKDPVDPCRNRDCPFNAREYGGKTYHNKCFRTVEGIARRLGRGIL